MGDRYELGRSYYVPAHHYGPCPAEDERPTLREAAELIATRDHPEHYHIEHRMVIPSETGDGVMDSPVMMFSGDGRRPQDFDYAAAHLHDAIRGLAHDNVFINALGVENSQNVIESHLGYARSALKTLQAIVTVVERGIERVEAEAERIGNS